MRQHLRCDHAARPRDVLHDERPPKDVRQPRGQHAPEDVGISARCRRRDDAHGLDRKLLRLREAHDQAKQKDSKAHRQPLLSTKRGAFTLVSNSLAMVPRSSSVTSGVIWNVWRIMSTIGCAAPVLVSTCRCKTSLPPWLVTSARKSTTAGSRNIASSRSAWLMFTPRTLKKPTVRRAWRMTGKTDHGCSPPAEGERVTRSPELQRRNGVMLFDHSAVTTSEPTSPSLTGSPRSSSTSRCQRSVKACRPWCPRLSPETIAASVMPK